MAKGEIVERVAKEVFAVPLASLYQGLTSACRPRLPIQRGKWLPVVSDLGVNESLVNVQSAPNEPESRKNKTETPAPVPGGTKNSQPIPHPETRLAKAVEFFNAGRQCEFDVMPGDIVGLVGESGCVRPTLKNHPATGKT